MQFRDTQLHTSRHRPANSGTIPDFLFRVSGSDQRAASGILSQSSGNPQQSPFPPPATVRFRDRLSAFAILRPRYHEGQFDKSLGGLRTLVVTEMKTLSRATEERRAMEADIRDLRRRPEAHRSEIRASGRNPQPPFQRPPLNLQNQRLAMLADAESIVRARIISRDPKSALHPRSALLHSSVPATPL